MPNGDLVIMLDHSNQIGTEKVLVVLGVNASALPEPGKALTHQDVRVLEVKPGSQWKIENMEQQYEDLADRYGTPRAVLVDGAVELRDGAKCLKNRRSDTIVLRDFKHYHLTPPSPQQKARFMNLASTIRWMTMIAWLLKHPDATAREGISDQRMRAHLHQRAVSFQGSR